MQYVAAQNSSVSLWKAVFSIFTTKRLVFGFAALLVILTFLYIYLINSTIQHVVAYGRLARQNDSLTSEINGLQATYISQKSTISLSLAYAQGYQDASTPQFISAQNASKNNSTLSYKYP